MQKLFIVLGVIVGILSHSQASTYGFIKVPNKPTPYCEYMPFDFVEHDKVFSQLHNRIWVKKPVTFIVTSPRYFGDSFLNNTWLQDWFGNLPLTGLTVIYKNTLIKPVKLSENAYQYTLPMVKSGDIYEFIGTLKYPNKGLKICVK